METDLLLLTAPLVVAELTMKVVALISLKRQPRTRGPKALWAALILLVSLFGWIGYFALGREEA